MQPARIQEYETNQFQINVTWDGEHLQFSETGQITLADGDVLILLFEGNLDNLVPGVTFERESKPVGPLGPFCDVLQTANRVLLKGSSGAVGTFSCQAWLSPALRRGDPLFHSSNQLQITNEISFRPAKEIRVDVREVDSIVKVTVDLDELTIHTPDSVVWNFVFTGLDPEPFEPLLYVNPALQPPDSNPFGPFESLSVAAVGADLADGGRLAYRLITSGNTGVTGRYHFDVGVLRYTWGTPEAFFSVVDPIIDNSGPPNR